MAVRKALLLGFMAGSIFGAAALWLFEGSAKPPGPVATASVPRSAKKSMDACSEDLGRALFELARERETVARLSEALEESHTSQRKPLLDSPRRKRDRATNFDAEALRTSGYAPDEIRWIRERWEQAEMEKRHLADLEARNEDPPPGGEHSDIERELREDLGDDGYDAMLYATNQINRVALERVQRDSIAHRAGLRDGTVVWSYDGRRVFVPKELATLAITGARGDPVEIVIDTDAGSERLFVERNPLGAELVGAKARPKLRSGR